MLLSPLEGEVVTTSTPILRFAEALDADGDSVVHDVEVRVDGALAFSATAVVAVGGVAEIAPASPIANGNAVWTVRGRDVVGPGAVATGHFVVSVGVGEGEGEGVGVGEGEGEGTGEGEGEGDTPISVRVGYPLHRLAPSCGCGAANPTDAGLAAGVIGALLALRRRRRRRRRG